jgi:hypothetical protein
MFGANTANREQPMFARIADAATSKIDGDRFDLNWVDWDNDRHTMKAGCRMNLGVDSWRKVADRSHCRDDRPLRRSAYLTSSAAG